MILQALYEYNKRNPERTKDGWIPRRLDFLVLLNEKGIFQGLRSLRYTPPDSKKEIGFEYLVPNIGKQAFKHTMAGNDANLLWDNASFALGIGDRRGTKLLSFKKAIEDWLPESRKSVLRPVVIFLEGLIRCDGPKERMEGEELLDGRACISFALIGTPSCFLEDPQVIDEFDRNFSKPEGAGSVRGPCLITGFKDVVLEPNHPVIKGTKNDKDPNFVSFNKPAYLSYGKDQSINAPCGKEAVRGYAAGLSYLLRDGSKQVIRMGKLRVVFWAENQDPLEEYFATLLGATSIQDPNAGTGELKQAFEGLFSGRFLSGGARRFFVLGVEPLSARLAVRFWKNGTVSKIANNLKIWFDDLYLEGLDPYSGALGLKQLARATCLHSKHKPFGDEDKLHPSSESDLLDAALEGVQPISKTILLACMQRIRAELGAEYAFRNRVFSQRVALIKAYLNRRARIQARSQKFADKKEEIAMSLDTGNKDQGYLLGRLFAVLEQIQLAAHDFKEPNAGIRDRFWGSFSSSPVTTLPLLLKVSRHHLSKLSKEKKGLEVNLDAKMREVMGLLTAEIKPHLALEDQARFAVGYYHQRQVFFTKSDKTE